MKKYLLLLSFFAIACQGPKITKSTSAPNETELNKLFKSIGKSTTTSEDSLYRGFHPRGKWAFESAEDRKAETDRLKNFVAQLKAIDSKSLTTQEKISRDVMLISLKDRIDQVEFKMFYIPFNAEGGFYNRLSYVLPRLPFKTRRDYSDYFKWLPNYANSLQDNVSTIRTGMREGVVAPKAIVKNTLDLLKPFTNEDYRQSPFYAPVKNLPASISAEDKVIIERDAEVAIGNLISTYKSVYDFFATEYMVAAKDKPGISEIPGGKAYYENRVLHYTTLPLAPDSVHSLGLQEVARIRETMEKIIKDVKFNGSFSDFLNFMRNDPQFYAKSPQELLNAASWLSKKAEGQLPRYFRKLYTLPFTVEPVPDDIAPTYTSGRYVPGSWDTKKAGIYWVNIYDLKSRPLYNLPALTVHEAVPGHHLQNMIAAEIKDLPAFRNRYYISAFGEGWGLYCEYLGEEMGMYATPYELFGRYTYEMWRACRLVVDTGIHYKGWTRDEAIKYLSENTALSMHEVTTEIDRYIGWPGQALSYKVGELKIKSLRMKAETTLKDKFDIRAFHEVVLENGSVPLLILESQVGAYIEKSLANK